jgi:hypothetical protein
LAVVGEVRLGDERHLIVVQADGTRAHIPLWMTLPWAADLPVHVPPRISVHGLVTLRIELDGVLSSIAGVLNEPGGVDEARQRTGANRPIHQRTGTAGNSDPATPS